MGTKLQAVLSIWICLLLSQCFTRDKGEEDFQGGYGYRQRVCSYLWQTLLPRDTKACYRAEPFCLSSWSRVDLFFFFSNQINSQGVFYLPDWFILVHILFRLGSGVSSPCWAWKAVTHRERWCLWVLQHEWGLLSLASAILFFLVLSWILTWLLVPKENQWDEYSDIKLSPLLVAQKVFTRNLNRSPRKKGGGREEGGRAEGAKETETFLSVWWCFLCSGSWCLRAQIEQGNLNENIHKWSY